jgi:transposase InsO family protein
LVTHLASRKYILIKQVVEKYDLHRHISYLCEISDVSRSGYYNYFSKSSISNRKRKSFLDKKARKDILKAIRYKNRPNKGARQIKMILQDIFNINYSLKKIRRIMNKFNLRCYVRRPNPYRKMMKATLEHSILPNLLKRNFKQKYPGKVLLTDITYLILPNGKTFYLSVILDASTNEVLAHHLSDSLKIPIVIETLNKLKRLRKVTICKDAMIHSDQGVHYTSPIFQEAVKKLDLIQSMSRRGNCWDNAVIESFFGHMKDEICLEKCKNLEDVTAEINNYMHYHNNHRYQWNMERKTPVQYRIELMKQTEPANSALASLSPIVVGTPPLDNGVYA